MLGSLQPHVLLLGEITPQAATLYDFITNVSWGSRLVGGGTADGEPIRSEGEL